jgi:hypothetical protein
MNNTRFFVRHLDANNCTLEVVDCKNEATALAHLREKPAAPEILSSAVYIATGEHESLLYVCDWRAGGKIIREESSFGFVPPSR